MFRNYEQSDKLTNDHHEEENLLNNREQEKHSWMNYALDSNLTKWWYFSFIKMEIKLLLQQYKSNVWRCKYSILDIKKWRSSMSEIKWKLLNEYNIGFRFFKEILKWISV